VAYAGRVACDGEPVEIRVRDDGPYKVTGPVRIVDPDGHELLPDEPGRPIVLCRCGQSRRKPFCDAAHKDSGFTSCVRAARASGRAPVAGRRERTTADG
jgi:CDGSH-type Zn-finger protein